MQDHFVSLKNHNRVHYLEYGVGEPVILLHTNGSSAYEYDSVIKTLGKTRRVIAWDQPGHGDSDRMIRHYSVEDYGDAVVEFMSALGLEKAHVFGGSIGGAIAVDLGHRHANRLKKLFVCEAAVRTVDGWAGRWLNTEQNYCYPVQTLDQVKARLRNVTPEVLDRWNIDRNKAGAWTMLDVMWALREYDIQTAMKKVNAKTMLVFGKKSQVGASAPIFEAAMPNAPLVMMDDCGHFPMLDDPESLASIIDKFIDA